MPSLLQAFTHAYIKLEDLSARYRALHREFKPGNAAVRASYPRINFESGAPGG